MDKWLDTVKRFLCKEIVSLKTNPLQYEKVSGNLFEK